MAMVMKSGKISNNKNVVYLRSTPNTRRAKAEAQAKEHPELGPVHKTPKANTESAVIQLERELLTAIKEKNLPALNHLLAHDFVYRSPYTKDLAKNEFLEDLRASTVPINKIWFGEMKVSVLEKIALINGVQKAQIIQPDGSMVVHQTAFSDVFIYRHGRWLLVSSYGVEMPS